MSPIVTFSNSIIFHIFHLNESTLDFTPPWPEYFVGSSPMFVNNVGNQKAQRKEVWSTVVSWSIAWWFCWWPFWDGEKVTPFKGLSDLQLGDQKVTLNHLVVDFFLRILASLCHIGIFISGGIWCKIHLDLLVWCLEKSSNNYSSTWWLFMLTDSSPWVPRLVHKSPNKNKSKFVIIHEILVG